MKCSRWVGLVLVLQGNACVSRFEPGGDGPASSFEAGPPCGREPKPGTLVTATLETVEPAGPDCAAAQRVPAGTVLRLEIQERVRPSPGCSPYLLTVIEGPKSWTVLDDNSDGTYRPHYYGFDYVGGFLGEVNGCELHWYLLLSRVAPSASPGQSPDKPGKWGTYYIGQIPSSSTISKPECSKLVQCGFMGDVTVE